MISKLKIGIFEDSEFEDEKHTIVLQVNPEDYRENKSVQYAEDKNQIPVFQKVGRDSLKLDFIIDGTGVIPSNNGTIKVSEKVKEIEDNLLKPYKTKGSESREQNHFARVTWGKLFFEGCLKTMQVHYKLFKPNGEPLRAKVSLEFIGAKKLTVETLNNVKNKEETLEIVVKSGETLSFLCAKHYSDSSLDSQIAKINGLSDLRNLNPGTKLRLPNIETLN